MQESIWGAGQFSEMGGAGEAWDPQQWEKGIPRDLE